jgi:hypothetical protein
VEYAPTKPQRAAAFSAEDVFKPVMIGELFQPRPLLPPSVRGIDGNTTAKVKGLMEVRPVMESHKARVLRRIWESGSPRGNAGL